MIFYAKVKGKVSKFHSHDRGGHLISEPKFKIPTPPPSPLLISDKSLNNPCWLAT